MKRNIQETFKNKRILLVEDNLILRELGRDSLENCGVLVTIAKNGYEAIELNCKNNYDLVIMDLKMPGLSGFDALKRMQEKSNCPQVMALTAYAGEISGKSIIKAGFHSVLTKPYTINEYYKSIAGALKN